MLVAPKTITLRRPSSADASIKAQVDPEGRQDKGREMKRVYSRSELRPADPDAPLRADQLIIGSKVYDVVAVEDFSDDPYLPHYEALVEQEGTDAVTVSTPTGAPTYNPGTGIATPPASSDSLTSTYLRALSLQEVASSAGAYQLGDVELRVKRDLLSVPPSTDTVFTDADGNAYAVRLARLDKQTQRWFLTGRRAS
jgi:hypothetical protein